MTSLFAILSQKTMLLLSSQQIEQLLGDFSAMMGERRGNRGRGRAMKFKAKQ